MMILCKTVGPPSNVSIYLHWIGQRTANRKILYNDLRQNEQPIGKSFTTIYAKNDKNIALPVYH